MVVTTQAQTQHRPGPRLRATAEWRGAAIWAGVVGVALVWGTATVAGSGVQLRAAPLYGRWSWHPGLGLLPAVGLGAAALVWGPTVAERAPWRAIPPLTGMWASAWALALAGADGWSRITAPLTTRHEYEPLAAGVGDLGAFLRGYVDRLGDYPIHVQGHPPGGVVVAWSLDRVGLGGSGWLAGLVLVVWGSAMASALVAARAIGGEAAARRAAPVLAVLPAAVWAGTSMDGLFAGIVALAVALAALAGKRGSPRFAVACGLVSGIALLCSYGAVPVLLVAVVVLAVVADRPGPLLAWAGAALVVPLALAAAGGFWWPAGLDATRHAYWAGVGGDRPALYLTLFGNPAALALATGPAVAVGLASANLPPFSSLSRRKRGQVRPYLLPLAMLVAVAIANLSQMSRGEVERIWLPFVPWLALAAPGNRRHWLVGQVLITLALQSLLVSPW